MLYILDARYRLRGWHGAPAGVYDTLTREARFIPRDLYQILLRCDAAHELDPDGLSPREKELFQKLLGEAIVRPAGRWDFLLPEQRYHTYPARYRKSAQWSVTGACNLSCRHCFMSAPYAKHGSPSHEEIMNIADQLAECGVFNVSVTGGEPLIRKDFLEIVDALTEREIGLTTVYTNGWLIDEALLNALEEKGVRPSFRLSFDGIGRHDFLRGVPGAEEKTVAALKLLQERRYSTAVSMCLHRKNASVLRESVRLLASLWRQKRKIRLRDGAWGMGRSRSERSQTHKAGRTGALRNVYPAVLRRRCASFRFDVRRVPVRQGQRSLEHLLPAGMPKGQGGRNALLSRAGGGVLHRRGRHGGSLPGHVRMRVQHPFPQSVHRHGPGVLFGGGELRGTVRRRLADDAGPVQPRRSPDVPGIPWFLHVPCHDACQRRTEHSGNADADGAR